MPEVVLNGVPVRFPFEPYEVQNKYMSKVIECLQNSCNGVLESPTGTGKTLSLLCSTLAWLEVKKADYKSRVQAATTSNSSQEGGHTFPSSLTSLLASSGQSWGDRHAPPKIIFSSRTHSQLSQAIAEFKRTSYGYLRSAVLGSRDQMCVHPEVSKETSSSSKIHMCQIRVKAKTCYFSNQVENKRDDPDVRQGVLDLEDLVKVGKKKSFCPYYMARELKQDADIIFMPYNYLLDPRSRKAHGVDLQGNVVIFDEAHNVEKVCEEAASLQIRSTDIALCIEEVTQVMKKLQDISEGPNIAANDVTQALPEDFTAEDLYTLKAVFLELEKAVDAIPVSGGSEGATYPGSFMLELLEKADINHYKKAIILEVVEKLIQYLTVNSASPFQRKGAGLQKFSDLIKVVYSKDQFSMQHLEFVKQCYKVHVSIEEPKKSGRQEGWNAPKLSSVSSKTGRVLSYWCFNPGFGMKDLVEQGVKCVILTSGTLSPLDSFTSELQIPFPVQLESPHIIKQHQVWVGNITKGPDGFILNSSFKNRSDPRYLSSLGQTIRNLSRVVPDGLLVFFPSYPIMHACRTHWQDTGIWASISAIKPIFVEPQVKSDFQSTMAEFYDKLNDASFKGACFMAVCRGKVSEGLDFADGNGRAVIITGIPYPPFKDPKVVLKKQYLEEMRVRKKVGLTGGAWYELEGSRAVNQAIGRVIRHKDDYGAIILCDERFGWSKFTKQLSAWVRPYVKSYPTFGPVMKDVVQFFKNAEILLPKPAASKLGKPAVSIKYEDTTTVLPAVAPTAAFHSAPSRPALSDSTKRRLAQASATHTAKSEFEELFELNYNTSACATAVKEESTSEISLFSALDKESSIIDFNNASNNASVGLSNVPSKPLDFHSVKKTTRKRIKLVPKHNLENKQTGHTLREMNNSMSGSGEAVALGGGSQESIPSGQGELVRPKTVLGSSGSSQPASASAAQTSKENGSKVKAVAAYIKEVQSWLTQAQYLTFSAAVKQYNQDRQHQQTINTMVSLFKHNHRLLCKFDTFLRKEHKEALRQACAKLQQDTQS